MGVFYVGRHGMTADDMPGIDKVTGWLDVGLNEQGRGNAAAAARKLRHKDITSIIYSDLRRTTQTARIIANDLGINPIASDKLRSWNMGAMQGMAVKAAKPFLTHFQENPELKPPKGEKFEIFYGRFRAVFNATIRHVRQFPEAHPLLITHSQNMDIMPWFIEGIEPGRALEFGGGVAPGEIMVVRVGATDISIRKLRA